MSTSQMHNPFAQAMEEHLERLSALQADVDKLTADNLERAQQAVDEMARLSKESLGYAAQLQAEWRKLGLEATKRAASYAAAPQAARSGETTSAAGK